MRNTRAITALTTFQPDCAEGGRQTNLRRLIQATIVGVLAALAAPSTSFAVTDDTEIFFNPYKQDPDRPNVLFIIDNSGSMDSCIDVDGTAADEDCDVADTRMGNMKTALYNILKNETLKTSINAGVMLFEGQAERALQPIVIPISPLDAPASSVDNGPTTLPPGVTLATAETTPSVRTRILNVVGSMRPIDGTPIVGALLEAGRYLRGDPVGLKSAFFRKTVLPNDLDQNLFGVSHQKAVEGGTFSICGSVNSAGTCTNTIATTCNSGVIETSTSNKFRANTNARCNFIAGNPTYKSPLTTDRGDQFVLAKWNADNTFDPLEPPPCRTADHIILLTDGEPTLFHFKDDGNRFTQDGPFHYPSPSLEASARAFTGAASCVQDPSTGDFQGEGRCGREIAAYLLNPNRTGENGDLRPGAGENGPTGTSKQWVITNTIAYALDSAPGKAYLQGIAKAGGGLYKEATDTSSLEEALNDILGRALPRSKASFASPRFASQIGSIINNDTVYVSLFEPANTSRWNGNVKKYRACTDQINASGMGTYNTVTKKCDLTAGGSVDYGTILAADGKPLLDANGDVRLGAYDFWGVAGNGAEVTQGGAGALLMAKTGTRTLYTSADYDPGNPRQPLSPEPINLDAGTAETDLPPAWFGPSITGKDPRDTLIGWIAKPSETVTVDGEPVTQDLWSFYDPMHASAVPITFAFGSGSSRTLLSKIFVPDNGGGLRMIDDATGQEDWMFIPKDLLPLQVSLKANEPFTLPDSTRDYGLDGSPVAWVRDHDRDGVTTSDDCPATGSPDERCDFVRLVFGQRDGGRRYFVVDITPEVTGSAATITPRLLWRIDADDPLQPEFADLGKTWSRPTMGKLRLTSSGLIKAVIIFGGGNDAELNDKFGPSATPVGHAVFVVDAETGELIQKIGGTDTTTNAPAISEMVFPIPGKITAFDSNGDGETDRLYYGDIGGNVWRSDIKATGGTIDAHITYKIADLAAEPGAAVTTPVQLTNEDPEALPDPIVASDTAEFRPFYFAPEVVRIDNTKFGGRFDMVIIASGHSGHPIDVTVHNAIFALKDYNVRRYHDLKADAEAIPPRGTFTAPTALDLDDLVDLTENPLQKNNDGEFFGDNTSTDSVLADLQTKSGWVIYMVDPDDSDALTNWRGEKSYSQPVVIAGKLLYTTFIPPTIDELRTAGAVGVCTIPQGRGRLYARDLLTGGAVFSWWDDSPGQSDDDKANLAANDTYREIGGVPPSELGIGVFEQGIAAAVGSDSESEGFKVGEGLPRNRIYWNER